MALSKADKIKRDLRRLVGSKPDFKVTDSILLSQMIDALDLYAELKEDIRLNGLTVTSSKGLIVRNPSLKSMSEAQITIMRCLKALKLVDGKSVDNKGGSPIMKLLESFNDDD